VLGSEALFELVKLRFDTGIVARVGTSTAAQSYAGHAGVSTVKLLSAHSGRLANYCSGIDFFIRMRHIELT